MGKNRPESIDPGRTQGEGTADETGIRLLWRQWCASAISFSASSQNSKHLPSGLPASSQRMNAACRMASISSP
jgi:hypothetical protein